MKLTIDKYNIDINTKFVMPVKVVDVAEVVEVIEVVKVAEVVEVVEVVDVVISKIVKPTINVWQQRIIDIVNKSPNRYVKQVEPVVVEPVVVESVVVEPVKTVITPRYIQNPWTNFRPYIPKQEVVKVEQNTTKTVDSTTDGWITVKSKPKKKPVIIVELCRFFKNAGWCRYGNTCHRRH